MQLLVQGLRVKDFMQQNQIPKEVSQFVISHIPTVPFLEAMLLIRSEREQPWDGKRLAKRLYMSERAASELLRRLHQAGFASEVDGLPGAFFYAPSTPEFVFVIDSLAATYRQHLVEVSNLIHSRNAKHAHQFADAFKLRKEP